MFFCRYLFPIKHSKGVRSQGGGGGGGRGRGGRGVLKIPSSSGWVGEGWEAPHFSSLMVSCPNREDT